MYKITINVLEQPSNELSIQASVNSKKEGRDGGTLGNNRNLIIQELLWASKLTQNLIMDKIVSNRKSALTYYSVCRCSTRTARISLAN